MDKMREEFEEWANAERLPILFLEKHGFYESHVTEIAWQAWQASRKSLVVELPSFFSERYESEICFTDNVESALDAVGVSYK